MTDIPRECSHCLLTNIIRVDCRTKYCALPYTSKFTISNRIISFLVPLYVPILRTLRLKKLTHLPSSQDETQCVSSLERDCVTHLCSYHSTVQRNGGKRVLQLSRRGKSYCHDIRQHERNAPIYRPCLQTANYTREALGSAEYDTCEWRPYIATWVRMRNWH